MSAQLLGLQGEPQLPPASLGDPLTPEDVSGADAYEITALPWFPVLMKPCVHPPRVEFPPLLWSSCDQPPLAFIARYSGGSSFLCQTLRLGCPMWGL